MKEHVWIVEVRFDQDMMGKHPRKWEPTVGIALSKVEGLKKQADWEKNCPDDEFRLTKYETTRDE